MANLEKIREYIIQTIKDDGNRKIPAGIIVRNVMNNHYGVNKREIYTCIDLMEKNEELKKLYDDKYVLGYIDAPIDMSVVYEGVISINSVGDGFIKRILEDDSEVDYYVNKRHVGSALRNDIVKFALLQKEPTPRGHLEAAVLEVCERSKDFIVGTIKINYADNSYEVIPDDAKFHLEIELDSISGLVDGEKILIKFAHFDDKKAYGTVSRILGHANDIGVDIESIVYDNGVPIDFDKTAVAQSKTLKFEITDHDRQVRRDITDRKIVSIDPASSKDLDDAVYVERLANGKYFLGVSIADVSAYVQPDTPLNDSAFDRGTSVYLVDRVIPMLPHNISDNLCSLNPNEDKMCITCDMIVDIDGRIMWWDVYPAIMRNHYRFSYDEVNDFFNNAKTNPSIPSDVYQQLSEAKQLHEILRHRKEQQGYIEFDIKEASIVQDEKGVPVDIVIKTTGTAQKMIEDFMVAANETVTRYAQENDLPFIYRTHDKPDLKKIGMFLIETKKLGFKIDIDYDNLNSKQIAGWIEANKDSPKLSLLNKLLLRSMQKAKYSTENIGHFGLALENYTHFTSPIRRYSDLIVHRLFWMYMFDKERYTDAQRAELKSSLNEIADRCNLCEARQVTTERDVNAAKFAEYMSFRIGEEYNGVISAVTSFGFFVELENTIEGLVSIKNITDDFYKYNEETMMLIGNRTGRKFTLGQEVRIKVVSASKQDRKIDFKLVN
ncbi:ribonuclease R [Ureaplasma ceti]|uniref:Ribonuclease R n=1 Tax=Ureaplasma ceti TaxID=3119530 RepID=A0ABP9U953_9BACT